MSGEVRLEGKGSTVEEALIDAMKSAPKQNGADILEVLEVERFGMRLGGIGGVNEFWVIAKYSAG